jgi:transcriptional regulator with XRE-family HTH domain
MTSFGQILNFLLADHNIGRAAFARRTSIKRTQLAGILTGKQFPDSEQLQRIMLALKIDSLGCMLLLETYKVIQAL